MQDQSNHSNSRLIDFRKVSDLTSLKRTKLYELINAGELEPIKLGRKTVFLESEIIAWVKRQVILRDKANLKRGDK